jgi:exonuclease III
LDNKCKKGNTLNFATWNVQGISNKEDQLDDILAQRNAKIAATSETKKKFKFFKEINNYIQIQSVVQTTRHLTLESC